MGFLSGVLGAVKNENEVTTYDQYISGMKLQTVLDTLTKNIGTGREGLAASVGAVKGWLGKYNSQVETLTNNVTTKLGELSTKLSSPAGEYYSRVSSEECFSLGKLLKEWKSTVKMIETNVNNIHNNASKLDTALRSSVLHEVKAISLTVKMLTVSATDEVFKSQVRIADQTLVDQRESIKNKIREESDVLHSWLETEFKNIRAKVTALHDTKKGYTEDIKQKLHDAKNMLDNDFDGTYRNIIEHHFNKITDAMEYIKNGSTSTKGKLREEFEKVKQTVAVIGQEFTNANDNLDQWKKYATKVVCDAMRDAGTVYTELNHKKHGDGPRNTDIGKAIDTIEAANTQIEKMNTNLVEIHKNLEIWKKEAGKAVTDAKTKVKEIVNKLDGKNDEGKYGERKKITEAVSELQERADKLLGFAKKAKTEVSSLIRTLPATMTEEVRNIIKQDLTKLKGDCQTWVKDYFKGLEGVKWEDAYGKDGVIQGLQANSSRMQAWIKEFSDHSTYNNEFKETIRSLKNLKYTYKSPSTQITAFSAMGEDAGTKIHDMYRKVESVNGNIMPKFEESKSTAIDTNIKKFNGEGIQELDGLIVDTEGGGDDKIGTNTFKKLG
ncbi:hypothetical protein, conserved [Babesia bigemina]|nr:hypothetical protein, conserved [Babesia bigemina]CDR71558.1 hypothetical protein, conserved [Babesia bigemina]|eukprot:XP_012770504.1 hypothetical protein, conserved [Babesia bigemina]